MNKMIENSNKKLQIIHSYSNFAGYSFGDRMVSFIPRKFDRIPY